jgi:putative transport protein
VWTPTAETAIIAVREGRKSNVEEGMEWFTQLFVGHGVAQAIVALSLAVVIGLALGQIGIHGVRFGVGGVLFSGIALAHFGMRVEPQILHFIREFGLILFVFTIGMQVGPGFFDSLRRRGLFLNLAAMLIVVLGVAVAASCTFVFDLPLPVAVGLLSGAVTNTPSLAAVSEVFSQLMPADAAQHAADAGMAYAVAYPFGIVGVILVMLLVRVIFRINPAQELEMLKKLDQALHPPLQYNTFCVTNPALFGMSLESLFSLYPDDVDVVVSRIKSPDEALFRTATPDAVLVENMLIHAVGQPAHLKRLEILVGPVREDLFKAEERGPLEVWRILVTKSQVAGKSVQGLKFLPEYGVTVTRIVRAGVEFTAGPGVHLHYGDKLVCVGEAKALARVAETVGNSDRELEHPHLMPIFLGILCGVIFGSIPIALPGLPSGIKLGLAGGPLLAAIILSRINHFAGLVWYMPLGANLILREVGIALFLACVGLNAGGAFVETLLAGSGLVWLAAGACITFFPSFIVSLLVRMRLKYDYASICGLLSGATSNPPALSLSVEMLNSDAPASVYATVYPLTMILRIFTAQLLALGLFYLT